MNLYAYVHNDPINLFDPDGKESRQVMQQEANTKDFLKGKITREEAQKNSYEIAGGDVGKAIVENLTPMRNSGVMRGKLAVLLKCATVV